jgi:hypothetical protein
MESEADVDRMTDPETTTLSMLARRKPDATICSSEVARAIASDWRRAMPRFTPRLTGWSTMGWCG